MKGKLIVLYGINNLGKSTQARLLVSRLRHQGLPAHYLKYGLLYIEPSGVMINDYLRVGNPFGLTEREFQIIHTLNRTQYDAILRQRLEAGEWIVAEDYVGTGLAWGMGAGVDRMFLERLNNHLCPEDLVFLFEGERFLQAKEPGHKHESDDELMTSVARAHKEIGTSRGWLPINANGTIEAIGEEIWRYVVGRFNLQPPLLQNILPFDASDAHKPEKYNLEP